MKGLVNILVLALSFFLGAGIYQGLNSLAHQGTKEKPIPATEADTFYVDGNCYHSSITVSGSNKIVIMFRDTTNDK